MATDHWRRREASAVIDDPYGQRTASAVRAIRARGATGDREAENRAIVSRNAWLLDDLRGQPGFDPAMLTVANRRMRDLLRG